MYKLSKAERTYIRGLLDNAPNQATRIEVEAATKADADVASLIFQLGVVYYYKDIPPGIRYSAEYSKIGFLYWNSVKKHLFKAVCGKGREYAKERRQIAEQGKNLIILLVPIIMSALNLPASATGVAIVLAILIAKVGVNAFCDTLKDNAVKVLVTDAG